MKTSSFIIISLLITYISYAQITFSGYVFDNENNPLENAHVIAVEANKATITNKDGFFELTNLPTGKITIKVSYIGFSNFIETFNLKTNLQAYKIQLKPSPIQSEEVVVSGGYTSNQHSTAVKIDVIRLESIKNTSYSNVVELLTQIPGVDMLSQGIGMEKPVIRGLAMDNILVLKNGFRYENFQYSRHHPLDIDEHGTEQIEIIKGPASLMYGSDAMGGVINFISEKPAAINSWQGDVSSTFFSNSIGFNNNIGIKTTSKKFFVGLRYSQNNHADYLQGGGKFAPNTRFNENNIKLFTGFTHSLGLNKLLYEYSTNKIGMPEEDAIEEITNRGRKVEELFQAFKTHLLQLQNKLFLNDYKLELNASYQNTEMTHTHHENEKEIDLQLNTLQYEAKLFLPSENKREYIVGYQGNTQIYKNIHNPEIILLPNSNTQTHSAFTIFKLNIFDNLTSQFGARYDYKSLKTEKVDSTGENYYRPGLKKNYQKINSSGGIVYNPYNDVFIRINVATGYRAPNIAELTSYGKHELRFEIGNSELKPQSSLEYDFSMHIHKANMTFDISAFYNNINKFIYIKPLGDTTSDGYYKYQYKQSDAYLYGGEADLHIHPKNHNWMHFKTAYSMVYGYKKSGEPLPFIPAHKLIGELRFKKNKIKSLKEPFIEFSSTYRFKQNRIDEEETPTSDYFILNAGIGFTVFTMKQPLILTFNVNNVFDKKYIDHLSLLKEVGLFNPGRNIVVSLKYKFGNNVEK